MGYVFNPFTGTLDAVGSGGGGGTPAAPDTSIQFNDSGSFGGSSKLTWDGSVFYTSDLNISQTGNGTLDFQMYNAGGSYFALYQGVALGPFKIDVGNQSNWILFDTDVPELGLGNGTVAIKLYSDTTLDNGLAIRSDTTTAHTALFQAYDVDGAAYATFATLTNGNTPSLTIAEPAGGALLIKPPTSDPHVAGALWNNSGLAVISSG